MTTVYSAALKLATVRALMERASATAEGFATMEEAVAKLASLVTSRYVGSNETGIIDGLEPSFAE